MKIRKLEIKKIIIPSVIVIMLFCILFNIILNKQLINYTKIYNSKIESIIWKIKENYPEIDEKEIMEILQNNESEKSGADYLKRFGYEEDEAYIEKLKKQMYVSRVTNILVIISVSIIILIIVMSYIVKQNKEINNINSYLRKVNNGKYDLKIEENTENELSKLKNELYKTTVLLRESAENSKKESKNLSIAIEDISHQLKTPLTSIRIMIDNLCENPEMDEKTRQDFLRTISKQIDWISSLIISILKIAKFDSGTIIMNDKEIKAEKLINEVIQNLSILIEIKEIKIITDIQEKAKFKADYKWQLEALTNVIKNSIEHSREKSKIDIKVEDSSLFLKIIIKDYEEGIDKGDIKHIFERFYKTKNSSEESIGIGLSLAKTIIEKDNGYITVDSEKNEGTTFIIKYMK